MIREKVPVHVVDLDLVIRGELHENYVRKNFLLTELDAIRRALEPKEKAAAKERQGTRTDKPGANFAQSRSGKTRKKIATQLGVSHTTLDKVAEVVDAAK
ncbi:MAG: hypothetical protein QF593_03095 [Nitrospinota bacterium]|nr:hypothetical protein [Nitrospinota bacterium]